MRKSAETRRIFPLRSAVWNISHREAIYRIRRIYRAEGISRALRARDFYRVFVILRANKLFVNQQVFYFFTTIGLERLNDGFRTLYSPSRFTGRGRGMGPDL